MRELERKLLTQIINDPLTSPEEKAEAERRLTLLMQPATQRKSCPDSEQDPVPLEMFRMFGPTTTVEVLLSASGKTEHANIWLDDTAKLLESHPEWIEFEDYLPAFRKLSASHTDRGVRTKADELLRRFCQPSQNSNG